MTSPSRPETHTQNAQAQGVQVQGAHAQNVQTQGPLQRLQVNDGMLITANHWQIAHSYHRQKQSIHYQAIAQGGIVSGLGISLGTIPENAPSKYRQPRWLIIQPGLAIDGYGNPIVVSQAESCYLSAQPSEETTLYVVLKHSEQASGPAQDVVQEAFQIIEKDAPPDIDEVELCRICMRPNEPDTRLSKNAIALPEDVFSPTYNQLDLRYRHPVRTQAHLSVKVAAWSPHSSSSLSFQDLFTGGQSLYPPLAGTLIADPLQGHLLHCNHGEFCQMSRAQHHQLGQYLHQGGVVLVEAEAGGLGELYQIETELRSAMGNRSAASPPGSAASLQASIEQEYAEVQRCIREAIAELSAPLQSFIATQQLSALEPGVLSRHHPIRTAPFTFAQLPTIKGQPIGLYAWGGLLLLVGPLPAAWGNHEWLHLSREEIRSAQELGINLLHFAARRHQLHQALTLI